MQIYCQTQCWVIGDLSDEEGLVRVSSDTSDFHIEKDTYTGVDSECTILKVEKLAEKCAKMPPGWVVADEWQTARTGALIVFPRSDLLARFVVNAERSSLSRVAHERDGS